jgi:serine phosphatase RsbU (regulator of sigma subunit)
VVFTDGVIEAEGVADRFGEDRLRRHLAGAESPLAAIGRVTSALEAFAGGEPEDDVALVAMRRSGLVAESSPDAGARAQDPTAV